MIQASRRRGISKAGTVHSSSRDLPSPACDRGIMGALSRREVLSFGSVTGNPSCPPLPSMVPACEGDAISGSIRKLRAQPPPPQMLFPGTNLAACRCHCSHFPMCSTAVLHRPTPADAQCCCLTLFKLAILSCQDEYIKIC